MLNPKNEIDETIGLHVPREAKKRLKKYREIARVAGLTHQHVSKVMRGLGGCSLHVLAVIAQAANVRLDHVYNYIIRQPGLVIKTRRTRAPRGRSPITPVSPGERYPEQRFPPPRAIAHKNRIERKNRKLPRGNQGVVLP